MVVAKRPDGPATLDMGGFSITKVGGSELAIVNATDEIACRNFQHGPINMATIDDPYDYNRDRLVNSTDRVIARTHQTGPLTALRLISAPGPSTAPTPRFPPKRLCSVS